MCGKYAAARAFCFGLPKNEKKSQACKTIRRRNRLCAGAAQNGCRSAWPQSSEPFENLPPLVGQPLEAAGGVCRTCRGKRHGGTAYSRLDLLDVERMRGFPVGENPADAASGEQGRDVVWLRAADAAVGRTGDFAASDDVPDRDVMREQKALLFFRAFRLIAAEYGGQHAPETVLRMPVKKVGFSGFDRRKAAQNQDAGRFVPDRARWDGAGRCVGCRS